MIRIWCVPPHCVKYVSISGEGVFRPDLFFLVGVWKRCSSTRNRRTPIGSRTMNRVYYGAIGEENSAFKSYFRSMARGGIKSCPIGQAGSYRIFCLECVFYMADRYSGVSLEISNIMEKPLPL
jgi:hypothetical protein